MNWLDEWYYGFMGSIIVVALLALIILILKTV